jgi:hypothetical protein
MPHTLARTIATCSTRKPFDRQFGVTRVTLGTAQATKQCVPISAVRPLTSSRHQRSGDMAVRRHDAFVECS